MNPRTDLTDWILRIKGKRNNSRFAREVRVAESSVRDLVRYDTLKLFSSETLGRIIEWEKRTLKDDLDYQPVMLTRGERVVLAYIRSLTLLPKRQYTVKRSKMAVPMSDLAVEQADIPSEWLDPGYAVENE